MPDADTLPSVGDFGAVTRDQKTEVSISGDEGLSATPAAVPLPPGGGESDFSALASAKC
jgi:hypothetical protein